MFHDGKSKAGAALLARAGFVHAVKPFENSFEGFEGYAGTVVLDKDLDLPSFNGPAPHGHGAVAAAVFDGIVHEVAEHLLQTVRIGADGKVRGLVDQRDALGGGPAFEILEDFGDDRGEGDRTQIELDAAGFQFGYGEQIFDEQLKAVGVTVNGLQEPGGRFGVVPGPVEQRFDVALDER